jgi:hypothetical protein
MTKRSEPGDILRYRSRPRHRGEILCHNQVLHHETMPHGANGFRYFVCRRGGHWTVCPCGWRPELGIHYAIPEHVKWWRREEGLKLFHDDKGRRKLLRRMFPNFPTVWGA